MDLWNNTDYNMYVIIDVYGYIIVIYYIYYYYY